jgi:hypothetical protein
VPEKSRRSRDASQNITKGLTERLSKHLVPTIGAQLPRPALGVALAFVVADAEDVAADGDDDGTA